jgi:hypothetical protein
LFFNVVSLLPKQHKCPAIVWQYYKDIYSRSPAAGRQQLSVEEIQVFWPKAPSSDLESQNWFFRLDRKKLLAIVCHPFISQRSRANPAQAGRHVMVTAS